MFFNKIFNNHQFKRLLAFLVDILVVILIGSILGFVFSDKFVLIGDNAVWIGFFVILLYHGILNSSINLLPYRSFVIIGNRITDYSEDLTDTGICKLCFRKFINFNVQIYTTSI